MKARTCGCGVKAFASEKEARLRFDKIHSKNMPGDKPTGVEQCFSGMWHLHYPEADTGPSPKLRAFIEEREENRCARCGQHVARDEDSIHHRVPRGRGGENSPFNLILLCGTGITGCHGWVEKNRRESYRLGYLVKTGEDPADIAVWIHGQGWAFPTLGCFWLRISESLTVDDDWRAAMAS